MKKEFEKGAKSRDNQEMVTLENKYVTLDQLQQAVLIQDIDWRERINLFCICPIPCSCGLCFFNCCEKENVYSLYSCNEQYEDDYLTYRFLEDKPFFFQKCCFPPSHRPLDLRGENVYRDISVTVEKPFKCTFFCFARPEMIINYKNQYIGKIVEPLQCSIARCVFHEIIVYDKNGSITYTIKAKMCQCSAMCFSNCMNNCRDLVYDIYDRGRESVGNISHIFGGFVREYCSKADKYGIKYPVNATVEEKILITVSAIFIDYLLFENM